MSVTVQHRRDTRSNCEAATPAAAELFGDTTLGALRYGDGVKLGGHLQAKWGHGHVITPTALAADTDDYAPTDFAIAEILALDSDADYTISGLAGGAADRVVTLVNKGDFRLTLPDQDAGSSANNRFDFGFNLVLRPRQAVTLHYDATASRWAIAHLGLFSVTHLPENVVLSGILTPSQITATQNDYGPAGLSTAAVLRLSSDASRNITGIASDGTDRVLVLVNIGAAPIVLQDANSNSSAGNRFEFGASVTLAAKQSAVIWYDLTASRWRLVAAPPTAGTSDVPADLELLLGQLALGIADNAASLQYFGDTGNRIADSFKTLTGVDTGTATNLDTGTVGVIKPVSPNTYATWNPSDKSANITLSDGNLTTSGGVNQLVRATQSKSAGKHYFEVKIVTQGGSGQHNIGFVLGSSATTSNPATVGNIVAVLSGAFANIAGSAVANAVGVTYATNDVCLVAIDFDAGKIWFGKNGTWTSGNPATGASPNITFVANTTLYPVWGGYDANTVGTVNFGATAFAYTVPSGYNAGWYTFVGNALTVASNAFTAASAPSAARLIARVKEIDTLTLNTDLIFSVSRDGGATYTAFAMTKKFTVNSIAVYESDALDISGQPTGTSIKWKITSFNNKSFEIHDLNLYWS